MEPQYGFIAKPLLNAQVCCFFLSSGSDVDRQRDEFCDYVADFNSQWQRVSRFRFEVDRWEQDVPHRYAADPLAEFRARARNAHCTVVLLKSEVRAGTREEIEAVLSTSTTQLSVLHMQPRGGRAAQLNDTALQQFLTERRDHLQYKVTGPPGSKEATRALISIIARTVAEVTQPKRELEAQFVDEH